jgi:hypothetical protein
MFFLKKIFKRYYGTNIRTFFIYFKSPVFLKFKAIFLPSKNSSFDALATPFSRLKIIENSVQTTSKYYKQEE